MFTILVPLDDEGYSRRSVDYVRELLGVWLVNVPVKITFLCIHSLPFLNIGERFFHISYADFEWFCREFKQTTSEEISGLQWSENVSMEFRSDTGRKAEIICAAGKDGNYDLIILSKTYETIFNKILDFASGNDIIEKVIRNSTIPILVVKS